jgi:LacI family transcriptional regulator
MDCSSVTFDNEGGAYSAVDYLIRQGHRKIGCVTGPLSSVSSEKRLSGYKKALRDNGLIIDEELIRLGDFHFESGYKQGLNLLDKDITAAFISNDMMAYGFYKAAREKGRVIPDDISVVGFDDLFFSSMLDVPLTTVNQDTDKMSGLISETVLKILKDEKVLEHHNLKTSLKVRNSVLFRRSR